MRARLCYGLRPVGHRRTTRYSAGAAKCPVAGPTVLGVGLSAAAVGGSMAVTWWALWWARHRLERVAVSGASMEPALQAGDRLVIWKTSAVRPGDIVTASDPRQPGRTVLKRARTVGAEDVWLLGDNPPYSTDSRHFGPVPIGSVQGKVVYRYAPSARAGRISNKEALDAGGRVRG